MRTVFDEPVLAFDADQALRVDARGDADGDARQWLVGNADGRSDAFDALPGVEAMEALLAAEPSGAALVSAFGVGALCGAAVAALLVPALPALAFGAALGAYAGVLSASLWVSAMAGAGYRADW